MVPALAGSAVTGSTGDGSHRLTAGAAIVFTSGTAGAGRGEPC